MFNLVLNTPLYFNFSLCLVLLFLKLKTIKSKMYHLLPKYRFYQTTAQNMKFPFNPFTRHVPHHKETSQLVRNVNQLTRRYGDSALSGLKIF